MIAFEDLAHKHYINSGVNSKWHYTTCHFSIIRYCPSYVLNETIVLGLFYILPSENKCVLIFPKKLCRIKALFKDANISEIRGRLSVFKKRAEDIKFDAKSYGLREASNIYFEPAKAAFYNKFDGLIENDYQKYFEHYLN